MKNYNKFIISIIILIAISVIIFVINIESGSFKNIVLSNFDEVRVISIIDSLQISDVTHTTDDYEKINNLLTYLNSLNLKQMYFRNSKNDFVQYRICLSGIHDKKYSNSVIIELNNKKSITVFFNTNQKVTEKTYKITNTEMDYNKLDEIFNNIK